MTLGYTVALKPDAATIAYFAGYNRPDPNKPNENWKDDVWDAKKAYEKYKQLKNK